jgi:formate dehydrogenase major subunit
MHVNLDACINCGLCVRACREVQVNDVIGMAHRGAAREDRVRLRRSDGRQHLRRLRRMRAGLPHRRADAEAARRRARPRRLGLRRPQGGFSVCPYCGVGCQLTYHVKDDKIVFVDGPQRPGQREPPVREGPLRLRLPQPPAPPDQAADPPRRRAQGRRPGSTRPSPLTHFREASWDEALDRAAAGLRRLRDEKGPGALAGFGSAKCSNEEAYLFQKLVRTGFGTNNVDHCTRLCHASSVAALMECIGSGAVTAPFMQAQHADVIILIGCNPTVNHPVAATYFKQAAKRGTKLIVLDPRGITAGRHAHRMLQFTPGSDVSLLNAMLNVIVTEGLYDEAYIAAHTEGFEALQAHVAPIRPRPWRRSAASRRTRSRHRAACTPRRSRAMIFWGMGISQHTHGTDNARCLIALALITGQVGRPGTGLHPLRGQNNVQGASDAGLIPMVFPDYQPVGDAQIRAAFEELWGTPLDPKPGLTVVEIMHAIHAGRSRHVHPGREPGDVRPRPDHAAPRWPCSSTWSCRTSSSPRPRVRRRHPAGLGLAREGRHRHQHQPPGADRPRRRAPARRRQPDWWIIQEIARRLGLDWHYTHPRDVFAEMKRGDASLDHITWERLEREESRHLPLRRPTTPGHGRGLRRPLPHRQRPRPLPPRRCHCRPTSRSTPPIPTVLITGRQLEHWHTGAMTRRATVLDALEPAAVATLPPANSPASASNPAPRWPSRPAAAASRSPRAPTR